MILVRAFEKGKHTGYMRRTDHATITFHPDDAYLYSDPQEAINDMIKLQDLWHTMGSPNLTFQVDRVD